MIKRIFCCSISSRNKFLWKNFSKIPKFFCAQCWWGNEILREKSSKNSFFFCIFYLEKMVSFAVWSRHVSRAFLLSKDLSKKGVYFFKNSLKSSITLRKNPHELLGHTLYHIPHLINYLFKKTCFMWLWVVLTKGLVLLAWAG